MDPKLLASVPLFQALPAEEIQHLAETLEIIEFGPDTIVLREDDVGRNFYIIVSGKVEIIKSLGTEDQRLIAVRGKGEP